MIKPHDDPSLGKGAAAAGDRLSDDLIAEVDMAAHVALERVQISPSRPGRAFAAGRRFVAARAPVLRSSFGSAVLLGLRFVQARLISVWGLIVAAALCPPFVFAAFAVFSAAAHFIATASLLRFEVALFQNRDRAGLGVAFRLSLAVGTCFISLAAIVLAVLAATGWMAPAVALFFLGALAARAVLRLLWAEATAEGDFRAIGNSNVIQSVIQPAIMLALIGIFGPKALALFLADALGHFLAAGYLLHRRWSAVRALVMPELWSRNSLVAAARRWGDAPRSLLPSALLAYGFAIAPVLALPYASNTMLAAQVALAMRLLDVPAQMFGTMSVPILLNRLRTYSGQRRRFWARILSLGLIACAGLLFGAVGFTVLIGDGLLDGTKWQGLGVVIAALAPFYAGLAILAPLQEMATLSRQPFWQVIINALALVAIVAAMAWFRSLSLELLYLIGAISILRTLAHTVFVWFHLAEAAASSEDECAAGSMAR